MISQSSFPPLVINTDDFNRVHLLAEPLADRKNRLGELLPHELARADLCLPWEPAGVSTGMAVEYACHGSERIYSGVLVYPNQHTADNTVIPILSPLGGALIGMLPGKSIEWSPQRVTVIDFTWGRNVRHGGAAT